MFLNAMQMWGLELGLIIISNIYFWTKAAAFRSFSYLSYFEVDRAFVNYSRQIGSIR